MRSWVGACVVGWLLAGTVRADVTGLSPAEIAEGWVLLFDGETTFGWKTEGKVEVAGGALVVGGGPASSAETTTAWGEFEVRLEYRLHGNAEWILDGATQRLAAVADPPVLVKVVAKRSRTDHQVMFRSSATVDEGATRHSGSFQANTTQVRRTPLRFHAPSGSKLEIRKLFLRPIGLSPIFNGKDLSGWKEIPGRKSKYTVTPAGELNVKDGPGDLQTTQSWADFVLQLDVLSAGKHLNSGVFFRALPGEFWSGYESQIRNQWEGDDRTKPVDYGTGGIYNRQRARKVVSSDHEWFTKTIVADGPHMAVWVNGYQVSDFTDTRPPHRSARNGLKLDAGVISLQGHDPTTNLSFRNLRIAELPAAK